MDSKVKEDITIDHGYMEIISKLNRWTDMFPKLKKDVFYFDDGLQCWVSKKKAFLIKSQEVKR